MELTSKYLDVFQLRWLFGPIADKELRVSSRRKRYYWLRAVYVATLLFFVCKGWLFSRVYFGQVDPSAYMAEIGKQICKNIIVLQFFGAHVIALFLLSGIFSEEISKRTLGVLLTTPITSFQIVTGKIASKLMQVFLLLCLSLPVLAIVRVFGGVQWDLIVYSTCITMLGVLFASCIIVFLSTIFTKTHNVFIASIIAISLCYSTLFFLLMSKLLVYYDLRMQIAFLTNIINPRMMFFRCFEGFDGYRYSFLGMNVQQFFLRLFVSHAIFILLVSLILMLLSAWRIRRVALMQMAGSRNKNARRFMTACEFLIGVLPRISWKKEIRDVKGRAVVWKEMHNSLFRGELLRGREIYLLLIASIAITYGICFAFINGLHGDFVFALPVIWVVGAMFVSVITAVTAISGEKETSSWQILLCTPLSNGEILWGKLVGIMRKSSVMWIMLLLLYAIFTYTKLVPPGNIIVAFMSTCGIVTLLTGIGVYFGLRCGKTSLAVMTSVILAAVVIAFDTFLFWFLMELLSRYWYHFYKTLLLISPLGGLEGAYSNMNWRGVYLNYSLGIIFVAVINIIIGLIFIVRAKAGIRKKIF